MKLKRILALTLALILAAGLIPAQALATEPTAETTVVTELPATTSPKETESSVPATTQQETEQPTEGTPETSVPETSVPESSEPETSVPESSVPESSVPETSVPETTESETSVPTMPNAASVGENQEPDPDAGETALPKAGDKIWVRNGSLVYKTPEGTETYSVKLAYEATITEIVPDAEGNAFMYKVKFPGIGALINVGGYHYVRVEHTSVDKPAEDDVVTPEAPEEGIPACTCGEDAPESLAQHADACPRKQYIKALTEGKTAQELYDTWQTYAEDVRKDILDFLKVYDNAKFETLDELLNNANESYEVVLENGIKLVSNELITAEETDEEKEAVLENIFSSMSTMEKGILDSVIKYFDIDSDSDSATITISNIDGISPGEYVVVLHFLDSAEGIEKATEKHNINKFKTTNKMLSKEMEAAQAYSGEPNTVYYTSEFADVDGDGSITFSTKSFSTFAVGRAVTGMTPSLLRNDIVTYGLSDLSIVELPSTLYKYTADKFNQKGSFDFQGPVDGHWANKYINRDGAAGFVNSGGETADQGIMQAETENGFPKLNLVNKGGTWVFDNTNVNGKEVFNNVPFEFVFDRSTGYYTYNSRLSHAQFNKTANKVELYSQSVGANAGWAGGAYFFNDINSSMPSSATPHIPIDQYQNFLYKTYKELGGEGTTSYVNDYAISTDTDSLKGVQMHFGMHLDTMFYLPPDKKTDGKDLIFNFTGDDDMWVFIDGQLVLDIGGGHSEVTGQIDLTNATTYVDKVSQWQNNKTVNRGAVTLTDVTALKNLTPDRMHRIQVFYLERFSWGSNCFISFNLPIIPDSSVEVTKNVKADDNTDLTILPDEEYKFKLFASKNGGEFELAKNTNYTIDGVTYVTDNDGIFKLKHGQTAIFDSYSRYYNNGSVPTKIYVQEILDNGFYTYTQTDITVNGAVTSIQDPKNSNGGILTADISEVAFTDTITYDFTNRISAAPLVVEKQVVGGNEALSTPQQKFNIDLQLDASENMMVWNLPDTLTVTDNKLSLAMAHGESIRLERVPTGLNYMVTESDPGDGFLDPVYSDSGTTKNEDSSYMVTAGGENKITVINEQLANLVIQKEGWQSIDENQTFLFHVKGTDKHNAHIDLIVTVAGNGTVTIPDVPVGDYTVTEDLDWSWRYENSNFQQKVTAETFDTVGDKLQKKFTFSNTRQIWKWMDGSSWAQNLIDAASVTRKPEEGRQ